MVARGRRLVSEAGELCSGDMIAELADAMDAGTDGCLSLRGDSGYSWASPIVQAKVS